MSLIRSSKLEMLESLCASCQVSYVFHAWSSFEKCARLHCHDANDAAGTPIVNDYKEIQIKQLGGLKPLLKLLSPSSVAV